jgi:hypothetical protein
MSHSLRCHCGTVQGEVDTAHAAGRAVCYCKDCQAYARFLGLPEAMLDRAGGTEIIATVPRDVRFTAGADQIACMSLSEQGLLRWYARCCRTAIGNTPRDPKISYVGLVRACLSGDEAALTQAFGPCRIALNTKSARGDVASTPVAMVFAVLRIMRNMIGSRIGGKYRQNPFFEAGSAEPVVAPRILTVEERRALDGGG